MLASRLEIQPHRYIPNTTRARSRKSASTALARKQVSAATVGRWSSPGSASWKSARRRRPTRRAARSRTRGWRPACLPSSTGERRFHYVVMMRPLSDKKRGPAHRRLGGGTQTISSTGTSVVRAASPAARRVRPRADFQRKTCHSGGLQRCRKILSAPH